MNPRQYIALFCVLLAITCVVVFFVNHFIAYSGEPYEMNVIKSNLALALDTHSVSAKVSYIDSTVEKLSNYHGNSQWWFPTHVSDIDQTRELLKTVSDDVKAQLNVKDREHYFILPHNELVTYMNSEIQKSASRIDSYGHGAYWNPSHNITIYIVSAIGFASLVASIIFAILADEYEYSKKWERKQEEKEREKERQERKKQEKLAEEAREEIRKKAQAEGKGSLPKGW